MAKNKPVSKKQAQKMLTELVDFDVTSKEEVLIIMRYNLKTAFADAGLFGSEMETDDLAELLDALKTMLVGQVRKDEADEKEEKILN